MHETMSQATFNVDLLDPPPAYTSINATGLARNEPSTAQDLLARLRKEAVLTMGRAEYWK